MILTYDDSSKNPKEREWMGFCDSLIMDIINGVILKYYDPFASCSKLESMPFFLFSFTAGIP